MNELIFFLHCLFIGGSMLSALLIGKEALISIAALFAVLCNVFVLKQITLGTLHITPTDALAIGICLSLNMLREYFGKEIAKKAIYITFFASVVYTVLSQIQLWYIPSCFDYMHPHFYAICALAPRIMGASLISYAVAQWTDYTIYGFITTNYPHSSFIIKNYCSIGISQLIDTVLFSIVGLYGTVENMGHIILFSYGIKCFTLILTTPFMWISNYVFSLKGVYEKF